jgi:hypothetical protein
MASRSYSKNAWKVTGGYAINERTGERLKIDYDTVAGGAKGTKGHLDKVIEYYLNNGTTPSKEDNKGIATWRQQQAWRNLTEGLETFIQKYNLNVVDGKVTSNPDMTTTDPETGEEIPNIDPKELQFNEYWRDMFSMDKGSGGREVYDNLAGAFQNQADLNMGLADAQYQSNMMQQAAVVKSIADQVRAERMQRLRAGMSEAQIASQDMQMLLANTNALSQQADAANQARLQAQFTQRTAKDDAYMAYLDQMNARGQTAAALYASDSGNPYWNTLQMMKATEGTDTTKWDKKQFKKLNETVTSGREPKEETWNN